MLWRLLVHGIPDPRPILSVHTHTTNAHPVTDAPPKPQPRPQIKTEAVSELPKVCSAHATALPATCFVAPFHYPVSYADLVILPRILACLVPVALPPPAFTLPPQLAHWFQLPT